ncbi:hypothetical protein V8C86DRAFT_3035354, partial [Haematococcus lacustris]
MPACRFRAAPLHPHRQPSSRTAELPSIRGTLLGGHLAMQPTFGLADNPTATRTALQILKPGAGAKSNSNNQHEETGEEPPSWACTTFQAIGNSLFLTIIVPLPPPFPTEKRHTVKNGHTPTTANVNLSPQLTLQLCATWRALRQAMRQVVHGASRHESTVVWYCDDAAPVYLQPGAAAKCSQEQQPTNRTAKMCSKEAHLGAAAISHTAQLPRWRMTPSHYKGKTKVRANEDEAWRSMEDQGASGLTPILLPPASFTLPYPMPPIPLLPTPPPRITPRNLPHHKGKTKVRANREPTWCGMEQNG